MLHVLSQNRWRLISLYMFCSDFFAVGSPQVPSWWECPSFPPICVSLSLLRVLSLLFPDPQVGWSRTILLSWLSSVPGGDEGSLTVKREWNLHCCVLLKCSATGPGLELSEVLRVVSFIYLFVCLFKVLNVPINTPNLCVFTRENACGNSAAPGYLLCLWNTAPSEPWKGKRSWYLQAYSEFHLRKTFSRTIKETLLMPTSKGNWWGHSVP